MVRLRQRSWDAFKRHALEDFELRMTVHLRKFYPVQCTTLGDVQVRRLIRYGIERARSHGITSEQAVCTYIDVMFSFGRDFDCDPALLWASTFLARKDIPNQRALAKRLFAHALEHREEARGIGAEAALP